MGKYISAAVCADIISEKFNIPLDDLIDVFAEIPAADVNEKVFKALRKCICIDSSDCSDCSYASNREHQVCLGELYDDICGIVNNQETEIERYKGVIKILENDVKAAKGEVIKEYKEKVIEVLLGKSIFPVLVKNALNEAEKEMVE